MKVRLRFTRQVLRGKCCARALYTTAIVFVLHISAYYLWTSMATNSREHIRNISSRGITYIGNETKMTFGWMNPDRIIMSQYDSTVVSDTVVSVYTYFPSNVTGPGTQSRLDATNKDFRSTHLMTLQDRGRLGNQMFQFAALLGISAVHGYTPFVSPDHKLTQVFDIPQTRVVNMTNVQEYGEGRPGEFDSKMLSLSHDKNWTLQGYYQSWKYFSYVVHDVRKVFRFKPYIYQKALMKLKSLEGKIFVGVHIRRGDMNSKYQLSRGYNVADETFINKALEYFRSKFKDPTFVVVGDEITWVKMKVKGQDVNIATSGSAGVDLAIMAQCNHSIVTSGTFGWWGAYLAGGHTVYFRNYPKPGSWLDSQYKRSDYYPTRWVGLS